jgi:hypothetical protein
VFLPQFWETGREVVDVPEGECAQAGRKGIIVPVVRDSQGPLEVEGQFRVRMHLRESEAQLVVFQFNHRSLPPLIYRLLTYGLLIYGRSTDLPLTYG